MEIIYKTKDGKEFTDKDKAEKWEALQRTIFIEKTEREIQLISADNLKEIFQIGDIYNMTLLLKDSRYNSIVEDSDFEIFLLDETAHLYCSDYSHGLLQWSEKEKSYFRIVQGVEWKVELLGIKNIIYC